MSTLDYTEDELELINNYCGDQFYERLYELIDDSDPRLIKFIELLMRLKCDV